MVTGPTSSQFFRVQTQAQPWLLRLTDAWLMDVSDFNSSIEQPQDVWAGGPPDSAKMEAKGIQSQGDASATLALGKSPPRVQMQLEGGSTLFPCLGDYTFA